MSQWFSDVLLGSVCAEKPSQCRVVRLHSLKGDKLKKLNGSTGEQSESDSFLVLHRNLVRNYTFKWARLKTFCKLSARWNFEWFKLWCSVQTCQAGLLASEYPIIVLVFLGALLCIFLLLD
eukprot:c18817_g1_i1 orf=459-821(+)